MTQWHQEEHHRNLYVFHSETQAVRGNKCYPEQGSFPNEIHHLYPEDVWGFWGSTKHSSCRIGKKTWSPYLASPGYHRVDLKVAPRFLETSFPPKRSLAAMWMWWAPSAEMHAPDIEVLRRPVGRMEHRVESVKQVNCLMNKVWFGHKLWVRSYRSYSVYSLVIVNENETYGFILFFKNFLQIIELWDGSSRFHSARDMTLPLPFRVGHFPCSLKKTGSE